MGIGSTYSYARNRQTFFLLVQIVFPLLIAAYIYLYFRSEQTLIYQLFDHLRLAPAQQATLSGKGLTAFFIYNLPGALWLYAYLVLHEYISPKVSSGLLTFWKSLPLLLALGIELFQLLGITDGTFDLMDVSSYILTYLIFRQIKSLNKSSVNLTPALKMTSFSAIVISFIFSFAVILSDLF